MVLGLAVAVHSSPVYAGDAGEAARPHRMVVLTDIAADPDDTQTLARLLLYSNVIEIQGLVATTSVHQKTRVAPESIRRVIETTHFILRVKDRGDPPLSRHQRVIVNIQPKWML